jgi:hypothetical protein
MKTVLIITILILVAGQAAVSAATDEFTGKAVVEGSLFFNDPLHFGQERNNVSLAVQPEYYHEWEDGSSFVVTLFARFDGADPQRSRFDIRELNLLWLTDWWELRVGLGKVFWGTTEFVHLVDIINQTDSVESIDGEEKLGQPMIHLSLPRDWGVVDLFVLPYFRERTFPGREGRLRPSLETDTDKTTYESPREERHFDYAVRYSHTLGDWDIGIYNFDGTSRDPTFAPGFNGAGKPFLIPHYKQINQTGIDLQVVAGEWLFKMEAIYRTGKGDHYFAGVGGFEYTFVGVADTGVDLSIVGEFAYDERGDRADTSFQNDAILGLRVNPNDAAGTEFLAGLAQDMGSRSLIVSVEASRRFGENWKTYLEARGFLNQPKDDLLFSLRNDDFIQLEIAYYF